MFSLVQVDPMTSTLDLADFSCRDVTVRFAVANQNGLSGFSESFGMLQVYGGEVFDIRIVWIEVCIILLCC